MVVSGSVRMESGAGINPPISGGVLSEVPSIVTLHTPPPKVVMYITSLLEGSKVIRCVFMNGIAFHSCQVSPSSSLTKIPCVPVVRRTIFGLSGWMTGVKVWTYDRYSGGK